MCCEVCNGTGCAFANILARNLTAVFVRFQNFFATSTMRRNVHDIVI